MEVSVELVSSETCLRGLWITSSPCSSPGLSSVYTCVYISSSYEDPSHLVRAHSNDLV